MGARHGGGGVSILHHQRRLLVGVKVNKSYTPQVRHAGHGSTCRCVSGVAPLWRASRVWGVDHLPLPGNGDQPKTPLSPLSLNLDRGVTPLFRLWRRPKLYRVVELSRVAAVVGAIIHGLKFPAR